MDLDMTADRISRQDIKIIIVTLFHWLHILSGLEQWMSMLRYDVFFYEKKKEQKKTSGDENYNAWDEKYVVWD